MRTFNNTEIEELTEDEMKTIEGGFGIGLAIAGLFCAGFCFGYSLSH